jgi:hypothetical protein
MKLISLLRSLDSRSATIPLPGIARMPDIDTDQIKAIL